MLFQKTKTVNESLEKALSEGIGKDYNPQIGAQVVGVVCNSLVDGLGIEEDEIFPEAAIIENLGAESIDGLDISFRIEKKLGVKTQYDKLLITEENTQQTVLGLTKFIYNEKIK